MKSLIETIQKLLPVDEDNTTGSDGFYNTPYAFRKSVKKVHDDSYSEPVEEMYERAITEINYKDFKNDSSTTQRQKINNNILEINKMLKEVERMVTHASKLKLESGADQGIFWKGTLGKFQNIDQRLNRLSNKIREFNT